MGRGYFFPNPRLFLTCGSSCRSTESTTYTNPASSPNRHTHALTRASVTSPRSKCISFPTPKLSPSCTAEFIAFSNNVVEKHPGRILETILPGRHRSLRRRSGCSPALPYPPRRRLQYYLNPSFSTTFLLPFITLFFSLCGLDNGDHFNQPTTILAPAAAPHHLAFAPPTFAFTPVAITGMDSNCLPVSSLVRDKEDGKLKYSQSSGWRET